MCILGESHSYSNHCSHSRRKFAIHDPRDLYPLIHTRGWTWHIYRQESAEYFWGFEFRESVCFWVLVTAPVFFLGGGGLLNKRCILKCFICSTVLFGSSIIHQVLQ